jgi:hypothetical protein
MRTFASVEAHDAAMRDTDLYQQQLGLTAP